MDQTEEVYIKPIDKFPETRPVAGQMAGRYWDGGVVGGWRHGGRVYEEELDGYLKSRREDEDIYMRIGKRRRRVKKSQLTV